MRGDSKTGRRRVRAAERRVQAVELRKAGLSYRRIGEELGITRQAAHKLVTTALRDLNDKVAEDAAELMRLELERLDDMQVAATRRLRGDQALPAIDRILRIMGRRAKMLGLDAPERITLREQEVHRYDFDFASLAGRAPEDLTDEELKDAMDALLNGKAPFL